MCLLVRNVQNVHLVKLIRTNLYRTSILYVCVEGWVGRAGGDGGVFRGLSLCPALPWLGQGYLLCLQPPLRLHRADVTHRGGQAQSSCLMCASDDRGRSVAQAKYLPWPASKRPPADRSKKKKNKAALSEPGFCCPSRTLRGCLSSPVSRPTTQ